MAVKPPLIGCTTYHKTVRQKNPIEMYGLMPSYTRAIVAAGGAPVLIPLGLGEESLMTIIERLDGLLMPGGGDIEPGLYGGENHRSLGGVDPDRDRTEFLVARAALDMDKPLLAICRGIQVLNVALGGTLWFDLPSQRPGGLQHDQGDLHPRNYLAHTVTLQPGSLVARCMGKTESAVNSLHHQALRDLAPELQVTGVASDGVIEVVEVSGHPFALGVQWHPENLIDDDPAMLGLFRGLVRAAAEQPEIAV
jgi:putative glutamine amidotransferase